MRSRRMPGRGCGEIVSEPAARLALVEMDLQLGAADRSERAVDQLLDRVRVSLACHAHVLCSSSA